MLEQGLVMQLQGDPAVAAISPVGGFFGVLPKGTALPSWAYSTITDSEEYTLRGKAGLSSCTIQIDCFASTPEDCIQLARTIDAVLSGYRGKLPDPDATGIDSCFRTNKSDFFDDATRTYRRMLEYQIWLYESA